MGVDRLGATDGLDTHLREADVANVAGANHVGDGAHRLLDRDVRIKPCWPVDVDILRSQPTQGIGEKVFHCRRSRVISVPVVGWVSHAAKLHTDQHLLAVAAAECVADE